MNNFLTKTALFMSLPFCFPGCATTGADIIDRHQLTYSKAVQHQYFVELKASEAIGLFVFANVNQTATRCIFFFISRESFATARHCIPGGGEGRIRMWLLRLDAPAIELDLSDSAVIFVEENIETDFIIGTISGELPRGFYPLELNGKRLDGVHHVKIPRFREQLNSLSFVHCDFSIDQRDSGDVLYSCPIHPGMSGAPVIDDQTEVVIAMHYSFDPTLEFGRGIESREIIAKSNFFRSYYESLEGCVDIPRLGQMLCD